MGLLDFLKKKEAKREETPAFQFYGSGRHLKSDEEMLAVDGKEADAAFRKYKREILDVYLKERGFAKYGTVKYARLNELGLIEYISLQKEVHGSRTATMNIALFPLYAPQPFITIGFGRRIGALAGTRDFWWDYKDTATAEKSFQNMKAALEEFAMPWFARYRDESVYKEALYTKEYRGIGYSFIQWIVHLHLKNHDPEAAGSYLDTIKSQTFYQEAVEVQKEKIEELVEEMRALLCGITDADAYLEQVKAVNIEQLKLPVKCKN